MKDEREKERRKGERERETEREKERVIAVMHIYLKRHIYQHTPRTQRERLR